MQEISPEIKNPRPAGRQGQHPIGQQGGIAQLGLVGSQGAAQSGLKLRPQAQQAIALFLQLFLDVAELSGMGEVAGADDINPFAAGPKIYIRQGQVLGTSPGISGMDFKIKVYAHGISI